jgi:hypothetical protein
MYSFIEDIATYPIGCEEGWNALCTRMGFDVKNLSGEAVTDYDPQATLAGNNAQDAEVARLQVIWYYSKYGFREFYKTCRDSS